MTPLTLEEIEAIERGCEGVTSGPWIVQSRGERGTYHIPKSAAHEAEFAGTENDGAHVSSAVNRHIARCDPDTIRRLCAMAKRAERMTRVAKIARNHILNGKKWHKAPVLAALETALEG